MPQASDELREEMDKLFGDPISDEGPYKYLIKAGYIDNRGMWIKPSLDHEMTEIEWLCVKFMCDEWDYGYSS